MSAARDEAVGVEHRADGLRRVPVEVVELDALETKACARRECAGEIVARRSSRTVYSCNAIRLTR